MLIPKMLFFFLREIDSSIISNGRLELRIYSSLYIHAVMLSQNLSTLSNWTFLVLQSLSVEGNYTISGKKCHIILLCMLKQHDKSLQVGINTRKHIVGNASNIQLFLIS